ncbi:uncharacterized protein LOC126796361 [Argentina anserina]|uniref:uncharacterized protein LOC126796361 n=1 Tax=Argentina anserina TaxID=57926 RepID=UPI0021765F0D|nr:uncharacterized protein LOC126796361 [Potentilla anserina]
MSEKAHDVGTHPFHADEERKRQKRIKMYKYIGIFIVFQIVVMTVFALTVMKVKTPKIRLGNIYVQSLTANAAAPSFDVSFTTQVRVRNTNWGPYKFEAGVITFMYAGLPVGTAYISEGKARIRSTKKMDVMVRVNSASLPPNTMLGTELGSGVLMLSSTARVNGKVELMGIMKKRKAADMECSMVFSVATNTLLNLECE